MIETWSVWVAPARCCGLDSTMPSLGAFGEIFAAVSTREVGVCINKYVSRFDGFGAIIHSIASSFRLQRATRYRPTTEV